jgi:hypothetical protein
VLPGAGQDGSRLARNLHDPSRKHPVATGAVNGHVPHEADYVFAMATLPELAFGPVLQ